MIRKSICQIALACFALTALPMSYAGEAIAYLKSNRGQTEGWPFSKLSIKGSNGEVITELAIEGSDGVKLSIPWSSVSAILPGGNGYEVETISGRKYQLPAASTESIVFFGPNEWGGETSFNMSRVVSIQFQ